MGVALSSLTAAEVLVRRDFMSVVNKDLYLNDRTSGRPITLRFQSCQLGIGKDRVNIAFNGPESIDPPGLLVLQNSDVHGLLIGLEGTDGKLFPLNKTQDMGEFVKGDNLISFNAYLQGELQALAGKGIGLGPFYAALNFTMSYG